MWQGYPTGDHADTGYRAVGATIVDVIYGVQVTGTADRHITVPEKLVGMFSAAILPGAYLVDIIPLRTHSETDATCGY